MSAVEPGRLVASPGAPGSGAGVAETFVESCVAFDCEGDRLFGVVSTPARSPRRLGVVVVVGGPQYRAGSHRQFVQLSRRLADAGFPALRFDHRGIGDSMGSPRTFEDIGPDIAAAVDQLRAVAGVDRVVLWGLCDGASAALLQLARPDAGPVCGLCLLNPWVRTATTLARTHIRHHYLKRLGEGDFWRKLLTGRLEPGTAGRLLGALRLSLAGGGALRAAEPSAFQDRMARAWLRFGGPVLLLLSENDFTAHEFRDVLDNDPAWRGVSRLPRLERHEIAGADHTLSRSEPRRQAEDRVCAWLGRVADDLGL